MADDRAGDVRVEDDRTGMHPRTLERAVLDHLYYTRYKDVPSATIGDVYHAIALAVRDRLAQRWLRTARTYYEKDPKRVYYLSAEFLMGRQLAKNLVNLGLFDVSRELLTRYGLELEDVLEQEHDPGLGNGGLGRLAACFLDSMATLGLAGFGYGIRYEYGIFEQLFRDGWQFERGDNWLQEGNPWEIPRTDYAVTVSFGGRVEEYTDDDGRFRVRWVDTEKVLGTPYDTPVAGFRNDTVNTLRLWSAQASKSFDFGVFNAGDYRRAVEDKVVSETISKVLYPNDQSPKGRELRLRQQYFFTSCSIQDILRRFGKQHGDNWERLPEKVAIQLNDTHPAIAVPELMRILVDENGLEWERAWELTRGVIAYTNHTLLPEALETWPVAMFERLLPRHLGIIYEINRRFLREVNIFAPSDHERMRRVSIIDEDNGRRVRMAHLATVGSHKVNGVAALHTQLIEKELLPDFREMYPDRFSNVTNGVTPRRWILVANRALARAIAQRIGTDWVLQLDQLERLAPLVDDTGFHDDLRAIKRANKARLAALVADRCQVHVDPESLFDVHIKRIHEYKRQLMNCLHIVKLYLDIKHGRAPDVQPRTFLFAGKAAAGYETAKLIVKLINDVADTINCDPAMQGRLRVAFIPNYGVSLAEVIIPGADLSEQISTAGMEASGTGNMKFAMNGALTIGTLDGANIEIRDAVGEDNFFLFGLRADQVSAARLRGYDPARPIADSPWLGEVIQLIEDGFFSPDDHGRFHPITHELRTKDWFMVCADFDDYVRCQERVVDCYRDPIEWARKVVANLAHVGSFSSDRSIVQYAERIWNAEPVTVDMNAPA